MPRSVWLHVSLVHAVSRWFLSLEVGVHPHGTPCGFYGGQIGTGTGFSLNPSIFPCQYHSIAGPCSVVHHVGVGPVAVQFHGNRSLNTSRHQNPALGCTRIPDEVIMLTKVTKRHYSLWRASPSQFMVLLRSTHILFSTKGSSDTYHSSRPTL